MSKKNIWDKFATEYHKKPIKDPKSYEHKLTKSREFINKDMEALEIGCGTGGTALIQAPYLKHILATDISAKMIEIAKSRPEYKNSKNVTFKTSSLEDLNLEQNSKDVVFALSIIHLLQNPQESLEKIHKILKPNGIVISSTVCIMDIFPIFKIIGPILRLFGLVPYVNCFYEKDLISFIKKAGFKIEYQYKRKNKKEGSDSALFIIAKKIT